MKTRFYTIFLTLILALSFGAYSQRTDRHQLDTFSLKDLLNVKITTASKTSQALELASAVVKVISKDQIRMRNYQSLLDVLLDLPDIKVDDKMYSGMRNSLTIRGTQGSEKFIILMDGINIGSSSGEAMPVMQNYPVHMAEQIEVLFGPASALYGANAVSGIVNIISRKSSKKDLILEVTPTAGNYGYSNTTFFLSKKLGTQTHFTLSGQYYADKGPDFSKLDGDSLSSVAEYESGTFNTIYGPCTPSMAANPHFEAPMKAYNISAALHAGDFSFQLFRNYTRIPTALGNNTRNSIFNKDVYMAQHVTVANASYKKAMGRITSTTNLNISNYGMDPGSNYRNLYTGMEKGYKYSSCLMVKGEQQIDLEASKNLNLTAGIGYEYYSTVPQSADLSQPVKTNSALQGHYLGTEAFYKPQGLEAPFYLIQYSNTGAFFQAQFDATSKLNFTLGARYDHNSRFGSSFNPRLGVVYQVSPKTTLKALYGRAFRAPAPAESYAQYGSFATYDSGRSYHSYFLHLPNTGLKPVTSQNFEINLQHRFSDNIHLVADAYYTALSGLYVFANDNESTHIYNNVFNGIPVDYVEVFINNDRQKNFGGSLQLNWKHSIGDVFFNSYTSLSYVNGRSEDGLKESLETRKDMELDFISPIMVRFGTDMKAGKFNFSPRILICGKQHIAGISDTTASIIRRQTLPGYTMLNLSFRYNISKKLSVFANVQNALDQRYRHVSFNMDLTKTDTELYYGQPQDPIRFMGGLHFSF